ncbi:MAG: LysM peptidoglycan-binding domain-containing protein, partial [Chloroflexi bacterium]|nr:LysM peptidoglycan-binding domain-containing protein [Chloroflexota bacterium]
AATVTSQEAVAAAPTAAAPATEETTPLATAEPIASADTNVAPTPASTQTPRKPLVLLNPTTVRQGSSIGVTGSGFDAGATVDLALKQSADDAGTQLTTVQVDKSGGFGGLNFPVPDSLPRGNFIVEARQESSDKLAQATAVVAGGSPEVKLGTQVGKAGDTIQLALDGFAPNEGVSVHWNSLQDPATTTLQADANGAIAQASVAVPFGAVGNNAFVFIGAKSQSPVTIPFQLLNLYPSVQLSSYAIKPDDVLSASGKDFGPGEQVQVYLNTPDGDPILNLQADTSGSFSNDGGFVVPFGLRGKQTLIYIGHDSKAPATASFDMLPYTPSVQPSTYSGRPGTTVAFYATDFARSEVVHTFVGRTRDNPGKEVTCFAADEHGNAAAAGSYVIPGNIQAGQLAFTLIGSKSQAPTAAAVELIASDMPVQVPPQPDFTCPLDDGSSVANLVAPDPTATASSDAPKSKSNSNSKSNSKPAPTPQAQKADATPAAKAAATPKPAAADSTPAAAPDSAPAAAQEAQPAAPSAQSYKVKPGDSLSSIAQRVYGNSDLWQPIAEANQALLGGDPNALKPGMSLQIPPAGA